MNTMNNMGECETSNHGRNRICWYDLFQSDMEWLTDLSVLVTNDRTLGTASIIGAYCDLIDGEQLVLEAEAALKMVRDRVVANCYLLTDRWQHDPGWCGRRFVNLSASLQLAFIAYIVMGWHEEKAHRILQDPSGTLAALLSEAAACFEGPRHKPESTLFARFFLAEGPERNANVERSRSCVPYGSMAT